MWLGGVLPRGVSRIIVHFLGLKQSILLSLNLFCSAMTLLNEELKRKIIDVLNLEDITPTDIKDAEALYDEGLGLDSIDALELIVWMDKDYGIKLTDPRLGKSIFQSIETMATYISENRTK